MPEAPRPSAREALAALVASPARHVGFSLEAIHRACGSPAGQSPLDWLELAGPLVDGLKPYRRRLHAATAADNPGPLIVRDPIGRANAATVEVVAGIGDRRHPYCERDHLVDEEVAALYCMFLDREGLRRNATPEGRRSREEFERKIGHLPNAASIRRLEPLPKGVAPSTPVPGLVG